MRDSRGRGFLSDLAVVGVKAMQTDGGRRDLHGVKIKAWGDRDTLERTAGGSRGGQRAACPPMLPWFPSGVPSSAWEKTSQDPEQQRSRTRSRVREPFLKLGTDTGFY